MIAITAQHCMGLLHSCQRTAVGGATAALHASPLVPVGVPTCMTPCVSQRCQQECRHTSSQEAGQNIASLTYSHDKLGLPRAFVAHEVEAVLP